MRKFLTAALAVSILASMSVPVFAENETVPVAEENVVLTEQNNTAPSYTEGTIKSVSDEKVVITGENEDTEIETDGLIVLSLKGNILKASDLKDDVNVRYYAANNTVIDMTTDGEVPSDCVIDEFKKSETLGDWVDSNNNLAIYESDDLEIVDFEGNEHKIEDIEGEYIAVFYNMMTMSIPAITNPTKIVILGGAPAALPEGDIPIDNGDDGLEVGDVETNVVLGSYDLDNSLVKTVDGINLVPLRKIAEDLGYEVTWNGDNKSVQIGTEQMGVYLQIGVNSYTKSKMTPAVLSAAPELIDDTTYVPTDFFEEILETVIVINIGE